MMGISSIDEPQRRAARVAGFTGLFTMATAIYANYGISERKAPGTSRYFNLGRRR